MLAGLPERSYGCCPCVTPPSLPPAGPHSWCTRSCSIPTDVLRTPSILRSSLHEIDFSLQGRLQLAGGHFLESNVGSRAESERVFFGDRQGCRRRDQHRNCQPPSVGALPRLVKGMHVRLGFPVHPDRVVRSDRPGNVRNLFCPRLRFFLTPLLLSCKDCFPALDRTGGS